MARGATRADGGSGRGVGLSDPKRVARRWLLFSLALSSLVVMTYAGVMLAFSVTLTEEMADANAGVPREGRVVVVPVADPRLVRTHAEHGEGALLVAGQTTGSFPAGARDTSLGRALAFVAPASRDGDNATYEPATLELAGVPARNGTTNLSVDVAALAAGGAGWIVMGSNEETPRFVARGDVIGEVARFASPYSLGLTFAAGFAGFIAPLVAIIVTHRPSGRRGAPPIVCRECGSAMTTSMDFCVRCGAYRTGD